MTIGLPRAKAEIVFKVAGACVGSGVAAGKKVLGFGSAFGRKIANISKSSLLTAGKMGARVISRGSGRKDGVRDTTIVQPAPAVVLQPAPTRTEKIVKPRVPRAQRKKRVFLAKLSLARGSYPAESPMILKLTPEQVENAEFAGAAEKVLFKKALLDLENPDSAIRAEAAKALARIRHKLTVRALAARLFDERSAQVRKECVNTLAAIEIKEGLPFVENALRDSSESVRLVAVMGVYRLAGAAGASRIIRMLRDEDAEVRRMAACCVGWTGQESLAVELVSLLGDEAVRVRQAAAEAMGHLGNCEVVAALIERFNDTDESVRRKIHEAVEKVTGKKMSERYPENEEDRERLIAQWRHWWKDQATH